MMRKSALLALLSCACFQTGCTSMASMMTPQQAKAELERRCSQYEMTHNAGGKYTQCLDDNKELWYKSAWAEPSSKSLDEQEADWAHTDAVNASDRAQVKALRYWTP